MPNKRIIRMMSSPMPSFKFAPSVITLPNIVRRGKLDYMDKHSNFLTLPVTDYLHNIQNFLAVLADTKPNLRLLEFSWAEQESNQFQGIGTYVIQYIPKISFQKIR